MIWVVFARFWLEKGGNPPATLGQPAPQAVGVYFAFYQLLPEHAVADDP